MGTQRKSRNYEDFVEKFKARHTTDDCFTPANIYDCVVAFVGRRFGVKPCDIVRPFFPGKDFTKEEYPAGCVVVDNPPFSICAKIVQHYLDRGIRFFLFCPGLSAFGLIRDRRATVIASGSTITYDNGATVQTNFVTNLAGDVLVETASDLHDAIDAANEENLKDVKRAIRHYRHPDGTITAAAMNFLAIHHSPFVLRRNEASFIRLLDCGTELYGGGFLLSRRAMKRRKVAEKKAKRTAAKEAEAKYLTLELSGRERKMQKDLN